MNLKVNVLLGLLEKEATQVKAIISEYSGFFKKNQEDFKGYKKTYTPEPDTIDEPSKRGNRVVVTTVEEKLKWLEGYLSKFLSKRLSIEATNASGLAKAPLIVGGKTLAIMTSQELLALKGFLENKELMGMYSTIPVRSDAEIWAKSNKEEYIDRDVYEQGMMSGVHKSITKEQYIIPDPNLQHLKDTSSYRPTIATKDTPLVLGSWTSQMFSGEWTHVKRANVLKRRTELLEAVMVALKTANDIEAVESELNAASILKYLHLGEF